MAIEEVYYSAARSEIVARIAQRDAVFAGYVLFLGGVVAIVYKDGFASDRRVLLAIPIVGAAAATFIGQHHLLIGALSTYLKREWAPPAGSSCIHWDGSASFRAVRDLATRSRTVAHFLVVTGTSAWSVYATAGITGPVIVLWWIALVLTVLAGAWIVYCQWIRDDG